MSGLQKDKETNLTEKEARGKQKLQKRIRNGEIVIYPTDKSGKLVACLPSTYLKAGLVHTSKDEQVEWSELPKVEQLINRHMRALGRILNLGTSHPGQAQRLQGALLSEESPAPHL